MDVLTDAQLAALNQAKVGIRMDNEKYIRAHPELDLVMRALVKAVLRDRPANVTAYAHEYFARDLSILRSEITGTTPPRS
ncbi:hypothetical protein SPRG_13123 [Saprolegnia parasitica CBS 223.65]|uniref:RIIa domain-containing protein n=1 Tax=Saprolegnia parasitica (strain CBS 223.65) TaxID=695850 RepID=A0A067C5V7_SAPPC|nr:hypothetical protein SPRG_13123 [Saprolegnia parasitica CBS 223.65]KDO21941.1 hypothetical protein SPRG_13123 [Saprolegnia parasitica CBS 223.65]|eukprot:XP_012207382.1 hypothetical protein SPRG_13123 [Saprolegnia parasitica CBS 223.65]